ncbi:MAG TPA: hypothetical protein VK917_05985, partial [Ilumatobacter sp.]|nr:hypothetical protein [Ilumatobacter sp.]
VATIVATALAACGGDDDTGALPDSTVDIEVTAASEPTVNDTTASPRTVPDTTVPDTTTPDTTLPERADPAIFDYEPVRPVEYEVVSTQQFRGVEMQRIKFDSPAGGMAYGYLSLPVSDPVDAGILWGHGAPADGTDSFTPMSIFACAGATSVVVDAPYARPGALRMGHEFLFTEQDRHEQIQLIIDMRRALDLLTDLGATQLGFGGISYGSAMGGLLLGVDHRPTAAVLLIGNGGIVERFLDEEGAPVWPLSERSDEEIQAWVAAMLPVEPIQFVGDSTADLLFMSGDADQVIPPAEAERFHAAAPPGSELIWMEVGHDIPFEDMDIHNHWLGDRLGLDRARLDACTEELFPNGWDDL